MENYKIGSTIFYGYFDDPSDFNPDKDVKEGVLVEDDDDDYCVTIASMNYLWLKSQVSHSITSTKVKYQWAIPPVPDVHYNNILNHR